MNTPNPAIAEAGANISDNTFSRFDDELINKYFNDKGKQAIKDYVEAQTSKQVREALEDTINNLLEWRDQETDLDGRAVGEPYYLIDNEYVRGSLEKELATLQQEAESGEGSL